MRKMSTAKRDGVIKVMRPKCSHLFTLVFDVLLASAHFQNLTINLKIDLMLTANNTSCQFQAVDLIKNHLACLLRGIVIKIQKHCVIDK